MSHEPEVEEILAPLRRQYARSLPARAATIRLDLDRVGHSEFDADAMRDLCLRVHRLAGSGATYGFPRISECARALERLLEGIDPATPADLQGPREAARFLEEAAVQAAGL